MFDSHPRTELSTALPRHHLPRGEDFLLWSPCLQSYGYRNVDKLFATRTVERGAIPKSLARDNEFNGAIRSGDRTLSVDEFMDRNGVAGLLIIRKAHVILEQYGLGLQPSDRWSTMSMVKSMTATLVGAAILDGAIGSLDDEIVRYMPQLRGSAYAHVTVRHLLTMSSGVKWSEDYTDRNSDVNRYSKSLAEKVPGGVLDLLKKLPPEHIPGTFWRYNTGDTYLLGAVLSAATRMPLASFLSEKIWKPCGMEFEAFYTLESEGGQEIGGSRAGMSLRDIGRFAMFVMQDGVVNLQRILPVGWIDESIAPAFSLPLASRSAHHKALGLTGYGYSWWLTNDGAMMAMGHSGQRIYINRAEGIAVVNLAVYPEPAYASASEHDRDADLNALIQAVRSSSAGRLPGEAARASSDDSGSGRARRSSDP